MALLCGCVCVHMLEYMSMYVTTVLFFCVRIYVGLHYLRRCVRVFAYLCILPKASLRHTSWYFPQQM